MLDTFADAV